MAETYEKVQKERDSLRARLAEVEEQRDGLEEALKFYAADDADSVECGILESVYHRPATAALAKLEEK